MFGGSHRASTRSPFSTRDWHSCPELLPLYPIGDRSHPGSHTAPLNLPPFGGHPSRRENAPGVTDGKSSIEEKAILHEGIQGGGRAAMPRWRPIDEPGRQGSGPDGHGRSRVGAAGRDRRRSRRQGRADFGGKAGAYAATS